MGEKEREKTYPIIIVRSEETLVDTVSLRVCKKNEGGKKSKNDNFHCNRKRKRERKKERKGKDKIENKNNKKKTIKLEKVAKKKGWLK